MGIPDASNPPSYARSSLMGLALLGAMLSSGSARAQAPYDPGSALAFDGAVRSVNVAHATPLNSYPFTASAWIRTTENSALVRGIVSKYGDGSFNGWSLFLYSGEAHAWYLTPTGRVLRSPLGLLSGFVADGAWHHVVFTVGPLGGKLYLDGVLKDSIGWSNGVPTPPTAIATQPLKIGLYDNYPQGFKGDIDEVTVWSRELDADTVRFLGHRGPISTETGLVGSWRFDNGAGLVATDSTAAARNGTLTNSPTWIASDAPVRRTAPAGDPWWNVLGSIGTATFSRTWIITDSPGPSPPEVNVTGTLLRFDDPNLPIASADVPVTFTVAVEDAADGTPIPLAQDVFTQLVPINNHSIGIGPTTKAVTAALPLQPAGGLAEFLPGHSYRATVTMTHEESDASVLADGALTTAAANFTVLSGRLFFGGIETIFTALSAAPGMAAGNVTLTIAPNAASIVGFPQHRFGGTVTVTIDPVTHNATFASGIAVLVSGPAVDTDTVNGLRIRRGAITLNTSGASSNVTIYFPTGFGYTTSDQVRLLEPSFAFGSRALTQELRPVNSLLSYTSPSGIFVSEESKPVFIKAGGFECDLGLGEVRVTALLAVQSVRKKEVADLAAATRIAPDATKKASNDAWMETASTVTGPVRVALGPKGDARLYVQELRTTATTFTTHLPLGAGLSTGAGAATIVDDQFTAVSSLPLVASISIPQGRDCFECKSGGIGPQTLSFNAASGALGITPDGGLVAAGALAAPTDIPWGNRGGGAYAQIVHGVSSGSFMAPGFFLRGDATTRAASDRPGVLLNTGSATAPDPGTGSYPTERPDSAAYQTGAASYAGFNFGVASDGALLASCRLGNVLFPNKPLRACCKYYARAGGITGLHQVTRGSIAGTFVIDGFNLQIDRYRLAYLSNANVDSGINGVLTVGGYSRFTQDFDKLFLNCFGSMKSLQLPSVTVKKNLFYWNAEIRPMTMEFANGAECPPVVPTPKVLVVGCEAWVSHVQPTLAARLAIGSDGRLLPKKDLKAYLDEFPDLDSVLHLPGAIPLRGPQGSDYSLVPNTPAYFSLPTDPPTVAAPNGFLHFAAKTDVAFFEDLRVHVQTSGLQGNITSPLHVMGGWTAAGQTYWTDQNFDPARAGVPPGVTKESYRANNHPAYLVKATRNWKGIVKIVDCPLKWNREARLFSTLEGCNTTLPIFSVDTRINALGPTKTDLRFSKDFLPGFSLGSFAINELTEATGVITAFQNAGQGLRRDAMQRGVESMESMLQNQIRALLEQPLNRAIDPFADNIALSLRAELNIKQPAFGNELAAAFDKSFVAAGGSMALREETKRALTNAANANSLIGEIRRRVTDGRAAAQSIRAIVAKDGSGRRAVLPNLAEQLLRQFDSPVIAQLGGSVVRQFLNVQIDELDDAFASLDASMAELDAAFARVLTSLDAADSFAKEITASLDAIDMQILAAIEGAKMEIANRFAAYNVPAMNLSAPAAVETLKQDIRRILRDRLVASRISSEMQRILRERLADLNDSLDSAMDSVFQQVNDTVRSAISKAVAGLDGTFQRFSGTGDIAGTGAVAKINGHAVILGDKLNCLRVDGNFKLSFAGENGAEFELNAFLAVKDVSSRGGPGCGAAAGQELTEITIGAEGVKIGWKAGPNLTADLGVKFTLEGDATNAVPVNFGGYVKVTGGLNFAILEINELALAVAVGKTETFVSAGARVKINGWEFAGGFFAGKSCSLDPILLWAPDARQVIGREIPNPRPPNFNDAFAGVYFYAEGWIPINELFGIPSTCLLTIKVGAGMGFFVNLAGAEPEIGAKFLLGLDGEIICILGIHAEFVLIGRKRGLNFSTDGLRLVGEGSLCLEIGPCPFCIEICAGLTIIYEDGGWDYEL
jgi:hypothetical protein